MTSLARSSATPDILETASRFVSGGGAPPVGWRQAMKRAVRDPAELLQRLQLPAELLPQARQAAEQFPLFVPLEYLERIPPGNPQDPLLRQVLPLGEELAPGPDHELTPGPGYTADPVDDASAAIRPGLLQKYSGRALLIVTGACAVHCRYCFRRHYPYSEAPHSWTAWQPALDQLAADSAISEVLLSGGDPLTLADDWLAELATRLAEIPHVRRLRIHTRLPIVIPQRVTDALLAWLRGTRLTPWVVVHANHPAELDRPVRAALGRLVDAGVPVLNQAVLLRGVNDDAHVLAELCETLADLRVLPYYLHQLDRVAGAAHFDVPVRRGLQIMAELRRRLPGYAVPRYVQEVAGAPHKTPLEIASDHSPAPPGD